MEHLSIKIGLFVVGHVRKVTEKGPINLLLEMKDAVVELVTRTWTKASDVVKNASPGDLIEIDRGSYCHWAMYYDNGIIINIPAESKKDEMVTIETTKLLDVAGNDRVRINNREEVALVLGLSKQSKEEAVQSAIEYVGRTVPYGFLTENCEYYATKWLYGEGFSTQVVETPVSTRRVANIAIKIFREGMGKISK